MTDSLDDLLARSAPRLTLEASSASEMLREARRAAQPARRRRRVGLLSGIAAVVLVGSAGVATANSDWLWVDGLEDVDRSYTYTSPSWGQCELRFSLIDTHNPLIQADVDRIVNDWFENTDLKEAVQPYLAEAERRADDADFASPDIEAWHVHADAVQAALDAELRANGYADDTALTGSESHSQVQCENADWGGEDEPR